MKTILFMLLIGSGILGAASDVSRPAKPDFYAYNADGSVRVHGVYNTNGRGQVVKYTVFDGTGKLLYIEVPYYADDGRVVRADHRDAEGKLQTVVVYFDHFAKVLNAKGEVIDTQAFSQNEFLDNSK